MMGSHPPNPEPEPPPVGPGDEEPDTGEVSLWGKVILTAFPFLVVLLFLVLEWWVRRHS
ncbi:MAG: hypothetical protein R6T96_14065 [Longimicrobiales bacterium]